MKHWTQNLPEGKRIFSSELDQIEGLLNRQADLFQQINQLVGEVCSLDMHIEWEVLKQYSQQEIEEAKKIGPIFPTL
jgi:hypothetical protein